MTEDQTTNTEEIRMTTATRTFPDLASTPDEMKRMMQEHYGVWVSYVGDDGDMVALGHHEPKRVLAAFNRYARRECGLVNITDDRRAGYAAVASDLRWRMARLVTACDSPTHDEDERDSYCGRCSLLGDGGWYIDWADQDAPGAFPITMWVA